MCRGSCHPGIVVECLPSAPSTWAWIDVHLCYCFYRFKVCLTNWMRLSLGMYRNFEQKFIFIGEMIKILLNIILTIHFTNNNFYNNKTWYDNLCILTFYYAFAFYDSNAKYPAQRVQDFKPATDLKVEFFLRFLFEDLQTLQVLSITA